MSFELHSLERSSSNTAQVLPSWAGLLHWIRRLIPVVVVQLQMTIWTDQHEKFSDSVKQDLHSDSSIVAGAGEDAMVCRVPCHRVDCSGVMCFERGDEHAGLSSPDIHARIYPRSVQVQ
jgi:hypothetical protein